MQSAVCSVHNTWYIYIIKKINKESVIGNDFKEMESQNAARKEKEKKGKLVSGLERQQGRDT